MSYAQNQYLQKQGVDGKYRIDQIGCFLTAFCNLEERFGRGISPLDLNNYFVQNKTYIDIDDGIKDDLDWDKVSAYDGDTHVSRTVNHGTERTAGWPSTNNAIVRFYYKSISGGQMIFHFCLVADAAAHTIIDSWDGKTKTPAQYESVYGQPTAYAEYSHDVPAPPPPPPTPAPAAPATYNVVTQVPGFERSNDSANHINGPSQMVDAGEYYIFNQYAGQVNVTKTPGQPGKWINPSDNVAPPPPPAAPDPPVAPPAPPVEAPVLPPLAPSEPVQPASELDPYLDLEVHGPGATGSEPNSELPPLTPPSDWRKTLSKQGAGEYDAEQDYTIYDLDDASKPGIAVPKGKLLKITGSFLGPDGESYYKPTTKTYGDNHFYGVPYYVIGAEKVELDDDGQFDFSDIVNQARKRRPRNVRERIISVVGLIIDAVAGILHKKPKGVKK